MHSDDQIKKMEAEERFTTTGDTISRKFDTKHNSQSIKQQKKKDCCKEMKNHETMVRLSCIGSKPDSLCYF